MLPAGLDYDDDDHVAISPDEAVREAITCVFRRFDQLGSARQVVVSLRADGLRLLRRDIRTGKITWAQAGDPAVHGILIHPGYAGVFGYGLSKTEKHLDADGNVIPRQRRLPRGQWAVIMRHQLDRIQRQPALVTGFLGQTGLTLEPEPPASQTPAFQAL